MSTIRSITALAVLCAIIMRAAGNALAGPPFLTDDPDPVPLHHWEFYTFETRDQTHYNDTFNAPAFEVNNGVAPNTQLHLVIPETFFAQDGVSARGLGDTETGVKYRFLSESKSRPEMGIFPMAELPTGDQSKGTGNGREWIKAPLWLQKSSGPWTADLGGGYAYNPAPGQLNFGYGGLLIQHSLGAQLSLGGEIFLQGASAAPTQTAGSRETSTWNVGGSYNFTPDFSLLFSAGHSFQGDGNAVMYIALYRTWGPDSP